MTHKISAPMDSIIIDYMTAPRLEIGSLCTSCDNCRSICPEDSITVGQKGYNIETWSCTLCQLCVEICPVECIQLIKKSSVDELIF